MVLHLSTFLSVFKEQSFNRNNSCFGIEKAGAEDGDLVMTSDADEIINPLVLQDLSWFDPNNHYTTSV